jgi:hypothetical protein
MNLDLLSPDLPKDKEMALPKRSWHKATSDPLTEQGCPVCGFLKDLQSRHVRNISGDDLRALCNFHAWSVASVTQASAAARIFLQMLDSRAEQRVESNRSDLCERITEEERSRVHEIAERLKESGLKRWLQDSSRLCIPHSRKLADHLPEMPRGALNLAARAHRDPFRSRLIVLSRSTTSDSRAHADILGRVAEYLVAQRGLKYNP